MSYDAEQEEVSNFFSRYARLFDEGKWAEFASLFHAPALSVRGDGSVNMLSSNENAEIFFQSVAEAWRRDGYDHFTISGMKALCLGSHSRLATFTWHMHARDGTQIRQWRQSYQLVSVREKWCVLSSTFHIEEKAVA